jgi:subtilase family protein
MIVGLQEFPDTLEIHSQIQATLVPSRLLLTSMQSMEENGFISLTHTFGLTSELEDSHQKDNINSTSHHTWVRTQSGQSPIPQLTLDKLAEELGTTLARVSPVYKNPRIAGQRGLFCPLTHVLLIKPRVSCNNGENPIFAQNLDEKLRGQYELEHLSERTRYSGDYRYYVLKRGSQKTVYEIQRQLLREERDLVTEAQFEIMPFLSASASWPNDPKFAPTAYNGPGQWNLRRIRAFSQTPSSPKLPIWQDPLVGAVMHPAHKVVTWLIDDGCDHRQEDLQIYNAGTYFSIVDKNLPTRHVAIQAISAMSEKPLGAHGVKCAGIIAPSTNNGKGIAGIASKNCKVFPLACEANTDALRQAALNYAATQTALGAGGVLGTSDVHARVISWSEADNSWNPDLINPAIQAAVAQKIVICVATQDQGVPSITYPATHPSVIACGSCNDEDTRYLSNYGNELSVVAPGINIWTTELGTSNYTQFSATSAATPHVAALAALLLSVKPDLTVQGVRDIIEGTAEKIQPPPTQPQYTYNTVKTNGTATNKNYTWNQEVGYGLINVSAAMAQVLDVSLSPPG